MIQHHIMALLALAAAAISGMEAVYQFQFKGPKEPMFWLMLVVFAASIWLYLRARKKRKQFGGGLKK